MKKINLAKEYNDVMTFGHSEHQFETKMALRSLWAILHVLTTQGLQEILQEEELEFEEEYGADEIQRSLEGYYQLAKNGLTRIKREIRDSFLKEYWLESWARLINGEYDNMNPHHVYDMLFEEIEYLRQVF